MKTGKQKTQECTKRSIVYETWCLTCETRELEKAMEEESDEKKVKERICKAPKFKYIGETARSAYERGLEHQRDFEDMKLDSHILKHYLDNHKDDKMEDLEFGMRIVRNARSAFERQIAESVIIQSEKKNHFILNSKSEYNRCALPRLTAKVGNFTIDELERKKKDEKEREKELMSKIRALKVEKSKIRREEVSRIQMPAEKKRKISKETHKKVLKVDPTATKRKETMEETTKTTRHTKYKTNNNNKKQKTQHNTNNIKEESTDHLLELYGIKKREPTIEIPETTEPKETEIERNERLKAEWDEKLRKREEVIRKEELERKERKEKSEKMSRSWDLLNLCREIMSKEGYNWKVSKERRDLEREEKVEKEDRLQKARNRKDLTLEKLKKKEKQLKITTELRKIPENRRKILLLEIEKERILTLKEAKEELWSKHSQRKGRGLKKKTKLEEEKMSLERKLDIIEKEAKKYEEELEKEMIEIQDNIEEKEIRLNKQKRKKKHYEMLRWTVNFIEENKQVWEDEKKRRQKENEEEERNSEWKKLNKEEKINLMKVEEAKEKDINERNPENSKTERLKTVITDKEKWKTWREKEEKETILKKLDPAEQEQRCEGTLDPDEQAKLSRGTLDPAEQDLEYDHDFDLEGEGTFCTNCAYTPCICHLVKLQLKIKILKEIKKVENQAIQDIQSLNQKGESLSLNRNKHSSPDPNDLSLDIKESEKNYSEINKIQDEQSLNKKQESSSLNRNEYSSLDPDNSSLDIKEAENYSEKNKIQDKQSLNQKQESSSLNRNKYSSLDQDISSLDRKHKASGLDQEDPSLGQEQEVSRPNQGSSFWSLEQEGENSRLGWPGGGGRSPNRKNNAMALGVTMDHIFPLSQDKQAEGNHKKTQENKPKQFENEKPAKPNLGAIPKVKTNIENKPDDQKPTPQETKPEENHPETTNTINRKRKLVSITAFFENLETKEQKRQKPSIPTKTNKPTTLETKPLNENPPVRKLNPLFGDYIRKLSEINPKLEVKKIHANTTKPPNKTQPNQIPPPEPKPTNPPPTQKLLSLKPPPEIKPEVKATKTYLKEPKLILNTTKPKTKLQPNQTPTNQTTPELKPTPTHEINPEEKYKIRIPPLKKPTLVVKETTMNQIEPRPTNPPPPSKHLKLQPPPITKPPEKTNNQRKQRIKPAIESKNQTSMKTFLKPNPQLPTLNQPTTTQTSTSVRSSKPTPETNQNTTEKNKLETNQTKRYNQTKTKKTNAGNQVQLDIRSILARKKLERDEKLKKRTTLFTPSADPDISVHPSDQAQNQPCSNVEFPGEKSLGKIEEKSENQKYGTKLGGLQFQKILRKDESDWKLLHNPDCDDQL